MVAFGDSLTYAGVYEDKLGQLLMGAWNIINKGVSGNHTYEMVSRFQSDVLDQDISCVIIWGGINDVYGAGGFPAETIEDDLQSMYTDAKNTGLMVVALTISPFKGTAAWTSTKQGVCDSINSWIKTTAINVDYIIDAYSLLEDPSVPDTLLSSYDYGDHIHLSTVGYRLIGTEIYNTAFL